MKIFWATRDYDRNNFHIEEANPRNRENIGLDQVWELNPTNDNMESEIYVEEETLEKAAARALILFKR
jgi:hypothetical protein